MSILSTLKSLPGNMYQQLLQKKVAKIFTISAIIIYWTAFFSSILLVILIGENYYSPVFHYISDLGSLKFSPFPIIFDIGCIFAGLFSFPISIYVYHSLRIKTKPYVENNHLLQTNLNLILISGFLGNIGFMGVGLFSVDRNFFNVHFIFFITLFAGYYFLAFLVGTLYIFFKIKINKFVALYGFFSSIFVFIISVVLLLFSIEWILFEWIANFIMVSWLYPFLYNVLSKSPRYLKTMKN
ncbi:MAG: membrane protein of unknown function [Promethearchaeota archaeon]|nr:MAG: membrane protein of unknown function [Candidatus Lokiarchaeota archaeon]